MAITYNPVNPSTALMNYIKPYTQKGIWLSIFAIGLASFIIAYQLTGNIRPSSIWLAQKSNPALWVLDILPFIFAIIGYNFFYNLNQKVDFLVSEKTKELQATTRDLTLKLQHANNHDPVTELPNHNLLIIKINKAITTLQKDESLAVIMFQIKGFKDIQYNFGSYNANMVLKRFAEKLKNLLVQPFLLDAGMGMSMIARTEEDSFALLIPRMHKDINLETLVSDIQTHSVSECMVEGNELTITPIVSGACFPLHGDNAEIVLHRANIGLYYAKKSQQRFAIYEAFMEDTLVFNKEVLDELKSALENDELEVYYQPHVELNSGKIIGAEALIRFDNPSIGLVHADKLISLVEGMNLMQQLTLFVLKKVTQQLATWNKEGHSIAVSVNLSSMDVVDSTLPQTILDLLKLHKVSATQLKVELTERDCLQDQEKSILVLQKLAKAGIKISIEDFCSGYTSFAYLMNFPIQEIKIDKSFVMHMLKDSKKYTMVNAIMQLAHMMKVDVYAVGIEDKNTCEKLQQLGCEYGQGFYFSQGVSADAFSQLLTEKDFGTKCSRVKV